MKRKQLSIALALVLTLSMGLAACGGSGGELDVPVPSAREAADTGEAAPGDGEELPQVHVDPTEVTGQFTWWSFFDQTPWMRDTFNEVYPNIDITLEVFGGDEYETKIVTTIQSGQDVPDLIDLEEGYVYKFLDSDIFVDMDSLGMQSAVSDYYDWAVAMGTDSKGVFKGVCDNVSPVAMWYLRDAAEQWLGTDDNEEISSMLSDWEKVIDVAQKVKNDSDGSVYLLPNLTDVVKIEGYSITPFVRGGVFDIAEEWYGVIATARELWDRQLVADLNTWSSEWATAWNAGEVLIRVMPSWDYFTDWEANAGNVGVAKPMKTSYEGGTYRVIYADSPNIEACATFLRYQTTTEYQIANLADNNQMPANVKVMEELGPDYASANFGGQNILRTYGEICDDIESIVPDRYTREAQNMFSRHMNEGIKAGLDDEQIIASFKAELKDSYPEIEGL